MKPMEYGNMIDEIERLRKQLDAVLNEIPKNLEFARNEGLEEGAKVADTEEELNGPIPCEVLDATMQDPEHSLRSAVRATKKSIANRIRALKSK